MQHEMIKLGEPCTEGVIKSDGRCTHMLIDMDGNRQYLFQPVGINPETGQPVRTIQTTQSRLTGELVKVPQHILDAMKALGTVVRDKASGFSGIATSVVMHIDGCVHLDVRPSGRIEKTNEPMAPVNFNILQLEGEAIPVLSQTEKEQVRKDRPSPAPGEFESLV